jgi:hypothetical protein
MEVSAIAESECIVLSEGIELVEDSEEAGVCSAFLPQLATMKARARAKRAAITRADILRMSFTFTSSRSRRHGNSDRSQAARFIDLDSMTEKNTTQERCWAGSVRAHVER